MSAASPPDSPRHFFSCSVPGDPPITRVLPPACLLLGVARHVLDAWADVRDPLLQLGCRVLTGHSSPATGRRMQYVLPVPFCPAGEIWQPVCPNEDGTRSHKVSASAELNDWLLLVVTGLNWLHNVAPGALGPCAFHGPFSKVQVKALGLLAGEVSQFFHQCGGAMEAVDWRQKLRARTIGYRCEHGVRARCPSTRDAMVWASDSVWQELAVELGAQRVISGDTPPGSGGVLRVLLPRVRDPEAEAQMDGLRSPSCPQLPFPWQHWTSPFLFKDSVHGVDFSHGSHTTRAPTFADDATAPLATP